MFLWPWPKPTVILFEISTPWPKGSGIEIRVPRTKRGKIDTTTTTTTTVAGRSHGSSRSDIRSPPMVPWQLQVYFERVSSASSHQPILDTCLNKHNRGKKRGLERAKKISRQSGERNASFKKFDAISCCLIISEVRFDLCARGGL